jgi:hypothetical protein
MSSNPQNLFVWTVMAFAAIGFVWSMEAVAAVARKLLGL